MALYGDLTVVIATIGILFFCAYFFFKLLENTGLEHQFLKLLMIGFIIGGLFILGGSTLKASEGCSWVKNNETVTNTTTIDNTTIATETTYNYTEQCRSEGTGIATIFNTLVTYMAWLFFIYIFLFLIFRLIKWLGWLPKAWQGGGNNGNVGGNIG